MRLRRPKKPLLVERAAAPLIERRPQERERGLLQHCSLWDARQTRLSEVSVLFFSRASTRSPPKARALRGSVQYYPVSRYGPLREIKLQPRYNQKWYIYQKSGIYHFGGKVRTYMIHILLHTTHRTECKPCMSSAVSFADRTRAPRCAPNYELWET